MAAARPREATPPPVIGKAGSYTIFLTPPSTPKPDEGPRAPIPSSPRPGNAPPLPPKAPPSPPPVQVPPMYCEKPSAGAFGFFWDAVAKVQDAHSRLDEYLADWLGLDQSKYQWALNDYYENNGVDKEAGKSKELVSKQQII